MIKNAYIHIPFCNNICSYCDFCKLLYNEKWVDNYLDSLKKEIEYTYKGEMLETIYIGGGTPSTLNLSQLNKLFDILKIFEYSDAEITIECNIEDINEEKLKLFKEYGVNRISIGVQSFNDSILSFLGRRYNKDQIIKNIELTKKYFDNINIDLIYAVNGQTIENLEFDLNCILNINPKHISIYSLIIEKNTKFFNDGLKYIDDELDFKMYDLINNKLSNYYNHYEISNYSKKGYESKHNLSYWNNKEYYGFGLAAASYIDNKRIVNTKSFTKYLNGCYIDEIEYLSDEDIIKYELILGFRKIKGINIKKFKKKFNKNIIELYNIKELLDKKLLIINNNYIYINPKYIYVSNDILINFI